MTPKERELEIINLYITTKLSQSEIALKVGLSANSGRKRVSQVVNKYKLNIRPAEYSRREFTKNSEFQQQLKSKCYALAKRYYDTNLNMVDLAYEFGVSPTVGRNMLAKIGIAYQSKDRLIGKDFITDFNVDYMEC